MFSFDVLFSKDVLVVRIPYPQHPQLPPHAISVSMCCTSLRMSRYVILVGVDLGANSLAVRSHHGLGGGDESDGRGAKVARSLFFSYYFLPVPVHKKVPTFFFPPSWELFSS